MILGKNGFSAVSGGLSDSLASHHRDNSVNETMCPYIDLRHGNS